MRATRRGVTAASVACEEHGEHSEAGAGGAQPARHLGRLRPGLRTSHWPRRFLRWHPALPRGQGAGNASWLRKHEQDTRRVPESAHAPQLGAHGTVTCAKTRDRPEWGATAWKQQLGSRGCGAPLPLGRRAAGGAQERPAEGARASSHPGAPKGQRPPTSLVKEGTS